MEPQVLPHGPMAIWLNPRGRFLRGEKKKKRNERLEEALGVPVGARGPAAGIQGPSCLGGSELWGR